MSRSQHRGVGARGVVALLIMWGLLAVAAAGTFKPPPLHTHVVDMAGRLRPLELSSLDRTLAAIRTRTGFAIVALVVGSLADEPIEDVAYTAFNTWQIGEAGKDNGVLIVIAPTERKVHIETGKGVGGSLTDLQTDEIIHKTMGPLLVKGELDHAIEAGATAIEAALLKDVPAVRPVVAQRGWSRTTKGIVGGGIGVGLVTIILLIVSPTFRVKFGAGTRVFSFLLQLLLGILKIIAALGGGKGGKGGGYSGGGGRSGGGGSTGSY